jgi:hypothetical protein
MRAQDDRVTEQVAQAINQAPTGRVIVARDAKARHSHPVGPVAMAGLRPASRPGYDRRPWPDLPMGFER